MTEREVLLTGIGGQGVQLAAQVLARAAAIEDREVLLFGIYGGMMRGGNTDSTVVVADGPIETPPIVAQAWAAIACHDEYWEPVEHRLRPGALVVANGTTFGTAPRDDLDVVRLPADSLARGAGNPLALSLVLLGALAAATGLAGLDALAAAMRASLPPYRAQHADANARALRAGWEAVAPGRSPAWAPAGVAP